MSSLDYETFLNRIIDEGIEAAKADYAKPEDEAKLAGSVEGFEACRGANPPALAVLLGTANREAAQAFGCEDDDRYWKLRCKALEIEWVCNVVSAGLMNQGQPMIVTPTARGVLKAAEILGVKAGQN